MDKSSNGLTENQFQQMYDEEFQRNLGKSPGVDDFISGVVKIIVNYMKNCHDRQTKVIDFKQPEELSELINFDLRDKPENLATIMNYCRETLNYSVKTGHPRFYNQLFSGVDTVALCGQWLSSAANTSMYTYEVGPVFVLMERAVLKHMNQLFGFVEGDGIFAPGGSISNMYAISLARHVKFPNCKMEGLSSLPRMAILTSEQSHYSFKKGGYFMGIGLNNVILVKCDSSGRMMVSDLEEKIVQLQSQGIVPFIVNATCGTTVFGAFDPLEEIADICKKYGIWLHVDAAWGGAVILLKEKRHLMKGSERADSITWNPHKFMGIPLQCSAFLVKRKGLLEDCHGVPASYIFQQDKMTYDISYDTGNKSIQCGRHVDIMKLWLSWKAKGDLGFANKLDNAYHVSNYLTEKIRDRQGFELVMEPIYVSICFWYIPKAIRNLPDDDFKREQLNRVAPRIKAEMTKRGTMLVGYQPVGHRVNFFRMILSNGATTTEDMDFILDEIETLGESLEFRLEDDHIPSVNGLS